MAKEWRKIYDPTKHESKLDEGNILHDLSDFRPEGPEPNSSRRGYIKGVLEKIDEAQQNNGDLSSSVYKKLIDVAHGSGLLETNKSTQKQLSDTIKNINDSELKKEVASYTKEKLSDSYEKSSDSYSKE